MNHGYRTPFPPWLRYWTVGDAIKALGTVAFLLAFFALLFLGFCVHDARRADVEHGWAQVRGDSGQPVDAVPWKRGRR